MAFPQNGLFRVIPSFSRHFAPTCWGQVPIAVARRHNATSKSHLILRHSTLEKVENILLHKFRDHRLLAQALTHRSIVNPSSESRAFYEDNDKELKVITRNNERLELLGDRVFGLLATEGLFKQEEEKSEGQLTQVLQYILSRQSADKYFRSLGLHQYIFEADRLRGGQGSRYGDCFEALLAALFLDGGYEAARNFFQSRVVPTCDIFAGDYTDTNYKMRLQEYLVSQGLPAPALATRLKYNPSSYNREKQQFSQEIKLFGRRVALGRGPTRVAADQDAAKRLLNNFQKSKATCFLIQLARRAKDQQSLQKLQSVRAMQIAEDGSGVSCSS